MLRQYVNGKLTGEPKGYVGTHVDDLLTIAPTSISKLIEEALNQAFPIGEWESELFSYLGSEIYYGDDEVVLSQQVYAESRLFTLDIPKGAADTDLAGPDLVADSIGVWSGPSHGSPPSLDLISRAQ